MNCFLTDEQRLINKMRCRNYECKACQTFDERELLIKENDKLKYENERIRDHFDFIMNQRNELLESNKSILEENKTLNVRVNLLKDYNEWLIKDSLILTKKIEFLHAQRDEILDNADSEYHIFETEKAKIDYMNEFKKEFGDL